MQLIFDQTGDFEARHAAELWCAKHGLSVGRTEHGKPRGLMYGDYDSQTDIDALDGRMTGDMRNGPVFIDVKIHRDQESDHAGC